MCSVLFGCQTTQAHTDAQTTQTLFLHCNLGTDVKAQSRLAILESAGAYDYGLTTAHGIDGFDNCGVSDGRGLQSYVLDYRLAPDYLRDHHPSIYHDWAVIKIDRLDREGLVRFSLSDIADDPTAVQQAYIPQGRGLVENTRLVRSIFVTSGLIRLGISRHTQLIPAAREQANPVRR